jgi:hypothetical protein
VFGLCCTKRNCVDHSTHADPLMKPLQEPGLLVSAGLRARQPSYHRCSSARPDRTLSRRAPRPGSVLQKGKTHASSGVRTGSSRKSLDNWARSHGNRTPKLDPVRPKVGRLHRSPAPAWHADRGLRAVVARVERHGMPKHAIEAPDSSCTPPPGHLQREVGPDRPVYRDRVSKAQKEDPSPISKNQTKGKRGWPLPLAVSTVAFALRWAPLLGVARPRLPFSSPLCGPTSPNLGHPLRPARCHWKRTHGAHGRLVRARIGSK